MKITEVEAILLKGDAAYGARGGADEASDSGDYQVLVKVSTDEGLVGYSDAETLSTVAAAVVNGPGMGVLGFRSLRDVLVGRELGRDSRGSFGKDPDADAADAQQIWDEMYVGTAYYGRRGVVVHCMSALDNCMWSIRAQAAGKPLWEVIRPAAGGATKRDRVRAYASTLFRDTPDAMARAARGYVEKGFTAVKFGWGVFGEDPTRDVELVAAAREVLGEDRDLMVDPGWYAAGWKGPFRPRTVEENVALCERMADYGVRWVEDFIHPEHFDEYAFVRQRSPVPLAAGEQMATIWDFRRLIGTGCVDVVQPDLTRCGGLTVARQVSRLAENAEIDLVPHSWLTDLLTSYSLHLLATQPEAPFVEFNVSQSPLTRGVCGGALKLNEDGTVSVPAGIGLGVSVDEDFVKSHCVS